MSLLTQSLKRVETEAEVFVAKRCAHDDAPTISPRRASRRAATPSVAVEAASRPVHAPPVAPDAVPTPPPVSPAARALRDAILQDLDGARSGTAGKVVVLAGVQASADTTAAVAALSGSLVGRSGAEIIAVDASVPNYQSNEAAGRAADDPHGFTSLLDGTRELDEVVVRTQTPGLTLVPAGLAKADQQAIDPAAVHRAVEACRKRCSFAVINAGDWQAEHAPLIGQSADAVYLLVRANVTEAEVAKSALKHFDAHGVTVRGCILAGATPT